MIDDKQQLFNIMCESDEEMPLYDVIELFCENIKNQELNSSLFAEVQDKLGKRRYKAFINTLILSFVGSMYISAEQDKNKQKYRFETFKKVFGDECNCVTIAQKDSDEQTHYDA